MSGSSSFLSDVGKRQTIGRHCFTIERVIAEGGYGVVFLVKSDHGARFALKRLYVNDEGRLRECKSEIEILSLLSGYRNVAKYVDSSITRLNNGVYEVLILTAYYPITCTQQVEEQGSLTERAVLKVFCDMCEAVSVLHHCQTPVTHRDIKLENILVDQKGNYILCDFGSATMHSYIHGKHNKSVSELEEDILKHTTLSHRAPEIIDLYSNQDITTKIDIWALGVTLYRLCFNNLPFGESSLAIQNGHFSIPERSTYSDALHSLIYYCLQVDPEKRPNISQVSSVAFPLIGRKYNLHTDLPKTTVPKIDELISAMRNRKQAHISDKNSSSRAYVDRSEWVETTTIKPRDRPRAGRLPQPHASLVQGNIRSGLCHSDQSLHTPREHPTHSTNNISNPLLTIDLVSPFNDDFSQNNPTIASKAPLGIHPTVSHSRPRSQQQTLGFEDSFTDLLITTTGETSSMTSRPPAAHVNSQLLTVANVRGHRRYNSDTVSMLNGLRNCPRSAVPAASNPPPVRTVDDCYNSSLTTQSNRVESAFDDDFSNFASSQIPVQTQSGKPQLDEFGSEPFNPPQLENAPHHSWNYPSDQNFLPGFS
ncbi:AP2-associated protein kinase 1-like [Watersipora subatra]|uniref:AP2-associated protein kinase 1-like n=1 Tax=Watersipora subatra TaxID=2589382 RepID=UPI00355B6DD0